MAQKVQNQCCINHLESELESECLCVCMQMLFSVKHGINI